MKKLSRSASEYFVVFYIVIVILTACSTNDKVEDLYKSEELHIDLSEINNQETSANDASTERNSAMVEDNSIKEVETDKTSVVENELNDTPINDVAETKRHDDDPNVSATEVPNSKENRIYADKYSVYTKILKDYELSEIDDISILGVVDDHVFIRISGKRTLIIRTNLELDDTLVSPDELGKYAGVEIMPYSSYYDMPVLLVKHKLSYEVYNLDFELIDAKDLPDLILADENFIEYGTWDVSSDFSMFAYEQYIDGLFLYDVSKDSVLHIDNNTYTGAGHGGRGWSMSTPVFCIDDRFLSIARFGSFWYEGYSIYNISDNNLTYLNGAFSASIYKDKGFYTYGSEYVGVKGTYYDFITDSRIAREIEGDFAVTDLGYNGINQLVGDKVISFSYNKELQRFLVRANDIVTSEVTIIAQIEPYDKEKANDFDGEYSLSLGLKPDVWIIGIMNNDILIFSRGEIDKIIRIAID